MDIAVVGGGSMGTLLAHRLIEAGEDVTLIDRNGRLRDIRENGLRLTDLEGVTRVVYPQKMCQDFREAGPHTLVILATKAHDLPGLAEGIGSLLHSESTVMTIQNGIPWWYFQRMPHKACTQLTSLDPDGALERHIPAEQIVGCVAYPAAMMTDDGTVVHVEGDRFPLGELDGEIRPRTRQIAATLENAGFRSRLLEDIRSELWLKAWGALSLNPISALTHATMSGICEHKEARDLLARMMEEAQTVAEALGVTFRHTIEKRIAGAHAVGPHKTSMLQDAEAGREMEVEALIGAVVELSRITEVPVPSIEAVYACVSLLNEQIAMDAA